MRRAVLDVDTVGAYRVAAVILVDHVLLPHHPSGFGTRIHTRTVQRWCHALPRMCGLLLHCEIMGCLLERRAMMAKELCEGGCEIVH